MVGLWVDLALFNCFNILMQLITKLRVQPAQSVAAFSSSLKDGEFALNACVQSNGAI